MKYSENKLRSYVKKCFIDAFKCENREYSDTAWSFEWVMIKNSNNIYQLYAVASCKYTRVLNRVIYRLKHNLKKNFGIEYENTDKMCCYLNDSEIIDYNHTQGMFFVGNKKLLLSVFDENTDKEGNHMAYIYENLLFKYWGIDSDAYNKLPKDSEKKYLPTYLMRDWNAFKSLYNETFDNPIGSYDIICSSGVKRL